jgi:predicted nucleotidyltransferase
MVARNAIQELCERLVALYHPQKVLLFGSYACGTPDADSDVDLLVVMPPEGSAARMSAEIVTRLAPSFAVDVLVRSPETLAARLEAGDFFLREILANGIVLHEAA